MFLGTQCRNLAINRFSWWYSTRYAELTGGQRGQQPFVLILARIIIIITITIIIILAPRY